MVTDKATDDLQTKKDYADVLKEMEEENIIFIGLGGIL